MHSLDTVSDRLRFARTRAPNLSAGHLDRLAGKARGTCAIIEGRDQENITKKVAAPYARVLGIDLTWLMLGLGATPADSQIREAVEAAERGLQSIAKAA